MRNCGRNCSALLVAQDNNQVCAEVLDRILDTTHRHRIDHFTRCSNDKDIPESNIKNQLRRNA